MENINQTKIKVSKLDILKQSKVIGEKRELMIMAQSCQHDAVSILAANPQVVNLHQNQLITAVANIRDKLLENLVENYYK